MRTDAILAAFIELFSSWGMGTDDYCFSGEYALRYQGYAIRPRKKHFDFFVKSERLPWKVAADAESTVPPKGSKEMGLFTAFLAKTRCDPHLLPTPLPGVENLTRISKVIRIGNKELRIIEPKHQFLNYLRVLKEFDIGARWAEEKIVRWATYFRKFRRLARTEEERRICEQGVELTRTIKRAEKDGIPSDEQGLKGIAACGGVVRGKVRIVLHPDDLSKISPGNIIVVKYAKTGIVTVAEKLVGIIADQGGVSSHAASIAREMHIPCVVGVGRATELLQDGDEVVLDGNQGTVTPLR